MAAAGVLTPNKGHSRRCSSIPRPTSKLTGARKTPPCDAATAEAGSKAATATAGTPQTIVKPRTYSRTRRGSFLPSQNDPPTSFRTSRAQPPRLSLPATTSQHMDGSHDLSGIRQQLPLSRYSRHSLASLDAMVSSATGKEENKNTTLLPGPSRLTKANTSPCVTKVTATSPAIPQRQLMRPLGPPLPRSQTMGNLTCFAASVTNTPSPSKTTTRTISTLSKRSEVDVMDALAESRMTDKEIEYFNQVAKEVEANRQRMKGRTRVTRVPSNDHSIESTSSKTLTSLRRSNRSSDLAEDDGGEMMVGDSSRKLPFQGARLKIIAGSSPYISPTVLTPDSGVSMGSGSRKAWEINVKLVHFHEPVQYWRGRFSTLSDRLRSEDYFISSPDSASTAPSPHTAAPCTPKIDNSDSFEVDDIRRSLRALQELRSCCRTAEAMRSFEVFAQEIESKFDHDCASKRQTPFYTHSSESKARLLAAASWPKVLGVDKNIAAATMKMINSEPKPKLSMTRSKTTGDMGQIPHGGTGSTGVKGAKVGWRRPSYLKAQEEVLASETALSAERRARAVAAAQRNARRIGIGPGVATSSGIAAQSKMQPPTTKRAARHSLPRKSSASNGGTGTSTSTSGDMLKRVFSESVRSVRRMGRSFTGLSGSGDG